MEGAYHSPLGAEDGRALESLQQSTGGWVGGWLSQSMLKQLAGWKALLAPVWPVCGQK